MGNPLNIWNINIDARKTPELLNGVTYSAAYLGVIKDVRITLQYLPYSRSL
jgi:hypothetical protein